MLLSRIFRFIGSIDFPNIGLNGAPSKAKKSSPDFKLSRSPAGALLRDPAFLSEALLSN